MAKTAEREKIEKIEAHLKKAFCIDGTCEFLEFVKINSTSLCLSTNMLFILNDSKRGKFYITIST